ncbi:response regulator [Ramlibacter rhizophilus]|uniref:Response regulator n=1 Tax=Ramlibacter rhizophilus TaxID=1781167 RepID=A0A4Z0BMK6_9BURK|nr:response regulator [Ramlibacter rhizophilus]TFY99649.1 response regulator [Ramlibacter rhizophilus]
MSFQLFRRPGSVVILDDDPDYLDMLALVLPKHWHLRLHLRPGRCIYGLHREPPLWEIDAWNQQQIVDRWRQGAPLVPQILAYWARTPERFALARVCVVDFSMPGMDGLEVLGELTEWQGARVMLTGQADEQIAVRAFNRGLIDQFIPKQLPDISRRLIDAVESLLANAHPRHSQIWRATLSPDQNASLKLPGVEQALQEFAATRWVEWIAIGAPFGILGMDDAGNVSWLQLEPREGLNALAELAALEHLDEPALAEIRQGRSLVNLELRQALGMTGPCEPVAAFSLGESSPLVAALFPVPASVLPAPVLGYQAWMADQGPRHVED